MVISEKKIIISKFTIVLISEYGSVVVKCKKKLHFEV